MSPVNYSTKIDRINSRYNPEKKAIVESRTYSSTSDAKEVWKYVLRAMREVDETYTSITKSAGEAVKNILKSKLSNVDFEYQGSVMTNTHIKGYSDIDLLTLCNKFHHTEISKVREAIEQPWLYNSSELSNLRKYHYNFSEYGGSAIQDLRQLRLDNERILKDEYLICDTSKSKSIKITNQHFHRDVDIVTSAWFDSKEYVLRGNSNYRGIKIYQKDTNTEIGPDFPFLSIARINYRDTCVEGRLKKMIRFLKNVRSDADDDINLTSFDINAICYDIPVSEYEQMSYKDMVFLLWKKMCHLSKDGNADELRSVVGSEFVFKNKPEKVKALKLLENEVWKIWLDLK